MSTTMLDPYDAQMLDYHSHDLDVHMNVSVGSDSWAHEEALMEDDGLHPAQKVPFENVSIEVDMEDYDGSAAEYDMLNDTQRVSEENEPHELVDVEVYDVSQVHSPAFVSQPGPDDTEAAVSSTTVMPQGTEDDVFSTAEGEIRPEDLESTPTHRVEGLNSAGEQGEGVSMTDQVDTTAVEKVNADDDESTPTGLLTASSSENRLQVPNTADDSHLDQSREEAKISDGQANEFNVEPQRIDSSSAADTEKHDVIYENSSQVAAYEDPHEILEGVYIDPPPSVLLTIDIVDLYEASLFNDAALVVGSESKQGNASSVVLLQNRPTLYYEPLSSVFEAFRQETFLSDIPDISEGELVLEAFDLQLVMSEDNCYARGISLHDINMLHDACALTGPLRLKLRLDLPRFIICYQRLQERVAQHVVKYQEAEFDQVILPTGQYHDEPGQVNHTDNTEEELQRNDDFGDIKVEVSGPELEDKDDNITGTELQPETTVAQDSQELEPTEDNYDLEYVDNVETGAGSAPSELKASSSTTGSEEPPNGSVYSSDLQAPAKAVGETPSIDKGEVTSSTSRPVTPHILEKAAGDAVLASTSSIETEDTGTNNIAENHDLDKPLSEQFSVDSHYEAGDAREVADSTLIHDIHHPDVSYEEQIVNPATESGDTGEVVEQWDDEFYEEGEVDATWDYEVDQEEEEQDSTSIESSVTLSSRLSSKRSFHELDENGDEDEAPIQSPGPKKLRTE